MAILVNHTCTSFIKFTPFIACFSQIQGLAGGRGGVLEMGLGAYDSLMISDISSTRKSVSSGFPNTEEWVETYPAKTRAQELARMLVET